MRIAISLDEEQVRELASMAHDAGMSEEELVREAVDQLLLSWRTPSIPRFARRLGPLAPPATDH
jgi:metal-responsive CopG/Arc/MetJ family transcriptional regulator